MTCPSACDSVSSPPTPWAGHYEKHSHLIPQVAKVKPALLHPCCVSCPHGVDERLLLTPLPFALPRPDCLSAVCFVEQAHPLIRPLDAAPESKRVPGVVTPQRFLAEPTLSTSNSVLVTLPIPPVGRDVEHTHTTTYSREEQDESARQNGSGRAKGMLRRPVAWLPAASILHRWSSSPHGTPQYPAVEKTSAGESEPVPHV